jgi:D-glycero-D-manno-heptose 1,7-bisphosphate phosphatase
VFLDRDGVINRKMPEGSYIRSEADLQLLPGVPEAIAQLNRAEVRVLVVSNQRGVALGYYTPEAVNKINAGLQAQLKAHAAHVDAFYFCPHDDHECECRKPLPGMFNQSLAQFPEIDPETSVMIGDSLSDIEFGKNLKMRTIWIAGDPSTRRPGWKIASRSATLTCKSLAQAVESLLIGDTADESMRPRFTK